MNLSKKEKIRIPDPPEVIPSTRPFWEESLLSAAILVVSALFGPLLLSTNLFAPKENDIVKLLYSVNGGEKTYLSLSSSYLKTALVSAILGILLTVGLLILIRPSGLKPKAGKKGKNVIFLSILLLFGILAYIVLSSLIALTAMKPSDSPLPYDHKGTLYTGLIFSGLLTNFYTVLIHKMYLEDRTHSNKMFWETLRFLIVGLIATVFDFSITSLFQFQVFNGNTAWYATIVSNGLGFVTATCINYVLSTYMVYKASKSGLSKTRKGKAMFLGFSLAGLGLSLGLYYLLYNVLNQKAGVAFLIAPVCFVLRTCFSMVYDFCWRKFVVYRK